MATTEAVPMCRVLFVDDDAFYRDLAAEALRAASVQHIVVPDGDTAIAQLETGNCDLVVLDLSMPGRSGFEILEAIRGNERFTDLPIIVVTGNDDDQTVARAFELRATSFMAKPLNWALFVQQVKFVHKAAVDRAALRRAQRTAEFMSDLKSRLIGTLLTEFQTPLRSAMNFSRLLKEEADGPLPAGHYQDWVAELHTALERLGAVHVKLLNFGRAAGQPIQLDDHLIDVGQMVASCVERYTNAAHRRNVSLTVDDTLPASERLRLDGILMANALGGVVENAVKFTPRGGDVVVKLSLQGQTHLAITVQDGAVQLNQSQIDEVLGVKPQGTVRPEALEQVTTLKISRALVEAHRGELRMRADTRGMSTTILLPRQRPQVPRPLLAPTAPVAPPLGLRRAV